jgi:hypothetical protein
MCRGTYRWPLPLTRAESPVLVGPAVLTRPVLQNTAPGSSGWRANVTPPGMLGPRPAKSNNSPPRQVAPARRSRSRSPSKPRRGEQAGLGGAVCCDPRESRNGPHQARRDESPYQRCPDRAASDVRAANMSDRACTGVPQITPRRCVNRLHPALLRPAGGAS